MMIICQRDGTAVVKFRLLNIRDSKHASADGLEH